MNVKYRIVSSLIRKLYLFIRAKVIFIMHHTVTFISVYNLSVKYHTPLNMARYYLHEDENQLSFSHILLDDK